MVPVRRKRVATVIIVACVISIPAALSFAANFVSVIVLHAHGEPQGGATVSVRLALPKWKVEIWDFGTGLGDSKVGEANVRIVIAELPQVRSSSGQLPIRPGDCYKRDCRF